MVHIHNGVLIQAQINEIVTFAVKSKELEIIMLSKINKNKKNFLLVLKLNFNVYY
jgi:hypothetical protein